MNSTAEKHSIAGTVLDAVSHGMAALVLLAGAAAMAWPEQTKAAIPTKCVPWLLGVVMFGMGLSLRGRDFALVLRRPRDVAVGVAAQFLCMPLAAWAIARALGLPDEIALGVVLVGACPGGTASNVIAYLARGDVALSVTMTACSTLLAPLATPAIVLALAGATIEVDAAAMFLSIVKIVIAPVVVGVAINELLPRFAARIRGAMPAFSSVVVAVIVAAVVAASAARIRDSAALIALAVVLHTPESFRAMKSPGSMILWIFSNSSGSFSFTHASFEAVKLPGELSRWLRQSSLPSSLKARSP